MTVEFIVARGHAAKLFEAAEQAFNRVPLGVTYVVVGSGEAALAAGWNHGTDAAGRERGHERVGVVAALGDEVGRGQALKRRQGLWGVVALTCAQAQAHGPAAGVGHGVHFGAQPTTAAPEGLRSVFLRAPLARWWARTVVESTSSVCKASSCCTAAKIRA